jgi:thiamine-phosphate pyrophosphorylase
MKTRMERKQHASAEARSCGGRLSIHGLYAITPQTDDTAGLLLQTGLALSGGAKVVQYRSKLADAALRRRQAQGLLALCRSCSVPLIINDDLRLALDIGADGVHLGRSDGDLSAARRALGPDRLLGASAYDRLELAERAIGQGADHVAFGSVYPSPTKPEAVRAPLALLQQARARLDVPLVAIGGITTLNARAVIDAGAHALAIISALYEAPDIERAARQFALLFDKHS